MNPKLSAYAQVYGAFDFNRTPLAPPGTKVLVHEKPEVRGTWAPHAVDGWYLGPAENYYRCYRVWIHETTSERVVDTLSWLPTYFSMPAASPAAAATAAAQDLIKALTVYQGVSPLALMADSHRQALHLHQLADIFASATTSNTMPVPTEPIATRLAPPIVKQVSWNLPSTIPSKTPTSSPRRALPRVALPRVALPRVTTAPSMSPSKHTSTVPTTVPSTFPSNSPSTVPSTSPTATPPTTYAAKTGNLGKQRRARKKREQAKKIKASKPIKPKKQRGQPRSPAPATTVTLSPTPAVPPSRRHPHYTRSFHNKPTQSLHQANLSINVPSTYVSPHLNTKTVYDR
eukprot:scaffold6969_cov92-Attheya_sp.AAC.2